MDGADASTTFTDSVGLKTITPSGNAQIDTAQSKFGGASMLSDGTTDFLTTPAHADFTLTSVSWSIDCWVRFNSVASSLQSPFHALTEYGFGLLFRFDTDAKLKFYGSSNGTSDDIANAATGTKTDWATGTWYHLALTWDGTTYRVFVGGILEISVTSSTGVFGTSQGIRVGAWGAASYSFNGWIDEFRLQKGEAVWTENFTPPTSPYGTRATGGIITHIGGNTIHTFNESGTFTPDANLTSVRVLVVAGGGAGGGTDNNAGGGGGAGELVHRSTFGVSGACTVTIGAGGTGVSQNAGGNGNNSVFSTLTAIGGGGGGASLNTKNGQAGGSGGGGGGASGGATTGGASTASAGVGNAGGGNNSTTTGGGGGAGAVGQTGPATPNAGAGGDGLAYDISGSSVYYAGGGGGGYSAGANGGQGGGGHGGTYGGDTGKTAGTANTGGGGGGSSTSSPSAGANGGSGVVIVSYSLSAVGKSLRVLQSINRSNTF